MRLPAPLTRRRTLPPLRSACRALATSTEIEVTDPLLLYRGLVAQGKVKYDPEQMRALVQMRKLHTVLLDYQPPIRLLTLLESLRPSTDPLAVAASAPAWPFRRSALSAIGTDLTDSEVVERDAILRLSEKEKSKALVAVLTGEQSLEALDTPKGFLLTGPPGTGKSMLLDVFFQSLPVQHKVRFHYHHFLLSIYSKVHDALELHRLASEAEEKAMNEASGLGEDGYPWSRREEMKALAITKGWRSVFAGGRSPNDPDLNTKEFVLVGVARDLIKTHGWLLAFDEVQLVDIAGAGMLNRVLSWYWRLGGVVIGTSNRVPEDLYNSGVQRDSVSSFLSSLSTRSPVIEILSPLDYRRSHRGLTFAPSTDLPGAFGTQEAWVRWGSRAKGWFVKGEEKEFEEAVGWVVGEEAEGEARSLMVYGRELRVPWAKGGVARFSFAELCEMALGPADYITVASNFHTVILTDVPILPLDSKNEARRLITLLDSLYETKTRLLVLAEAQVDDLFFPDAVNLPIDPAPYEASSELVPPSESRPLDSYDDSATFPSHSALRAREAVDPAGEIGDVLTQEMLGDVLQDLEAPYRPNISSYDSTSELKAYGRDEGSKSPAKTVWKKAGGRKEDKEGPIHPSAAVPAFRSLAIFTGEEERFAFRRAVSRVHEMSSEEFLRTASWTPLSISLRTWERPPRPTAPLASSSSPSLSSIGPSSPLPTTDLLSSVLAPSELRLKYPESLQTVGREVEVKRAREQREKSGEAGAEAKARKGEKINVVGLQEDPRAATVPPKVKEDHVWGVREDWGKGAGRWGKGASAHEKGGAE